MNARNLDAVMLWKDEENISYVLMMDKKWMWRMLRRDNELGEEKDDKWHKEREREKCEDDKEICLKIEVTS